MSSGKRVVVIGTGYVGLPVAIMLARSGYEVVGMDIDEDKIEAINKKNLHIEEDELNEIFQEEKVRRNLIAKKDPSEGDIFIIAVPTPLDRRKKIADLSQVELAIRAILPKLKEGNLIIIESTVPPLTCKEIIKPMIEERTDLKVNENVYIAHCPERILPGNVFHEIIHNDRVIGGMNEKAADMAEEMYSSFVEGDLYKTDETTAELVKLVENAYRDINIAFSNEIDQVCDTINVNSAEVIQLANEHPRVNVLKPGIGVGGHCIPIDPWFIKQVDPENTTLIFTARRINESRPRRIAREIRRTLKNIDNPKIVALGLTYKPNTYDTRESPAIEIIEELRMDGYDVEAYDPFVGNCGYEDLVKIAKGKDCLVVLVEHDNIIQELGNRLDDIKENMNRSIILRPARYHHERDESAP